jgi:ketosteroid isomerase-like protein
VAEENPDVVRRCLEAFAVDEHAWLATLDAEMEWHPLEEGHVPSVGHAPAREVRRRWLEDWTDYRQEIEEVVAEGDDVVTTLHAIGRGRESGIEVEIRIYMHWKLRDGLITYMYEYGDRAEALRAAGLA